MKLNPSMFRGYDLRGISGKDLSPEIMEYLGKGYGTFLASRRVRQSVVGGDCRETSEEYKKAFIRGLVATGVDVIDLGLVTAPMMYFAQYHYKTNGGAIITASHNPKEWNGLKLATGYSETMITEEIKEFQALVEKGEFVKGRGKVKKADDLLDAYLNDITKRIKLEKKLKVVVDACNSTPGVSTPEILKRIGCEVIEQNCNIDPTFPNGTPDPTEEKVQKRLARGVLENKADLGFSFDSDGDRMGVVDNNGGLVWNDVIVALMAADVIDHLPGAKIVYNVLCSQVVSDTIKSKGGNEVMWITGHSFIKAKAQNERASFAGELSGHFYFLDNFYGHDDGAYTACRILEYLSNQDGPLSDILNTLPQYISSPEVKVGCPDGIKEKVLDQITRNFQQKFKGQKITTIDGIRVDWKDSMLIIRYSQNGPYITVKFEAKEKERYEELKNIINEELKKYPEINWEEGVNLQTLK